VPLYVHKSDVKPNHDAWLHPRHHVHAIGFAGRPATLLCMALLCFAPASLHSQIYSSDLESRGVFGLNTRIAATGGGGQTEPSAYRIERFTRVGLFLAVSSLGIGGQISTNLSPYLDIRFFGNRASVTTHHFSQKDFAIGVNMGFANVGATADAYPFRKPFRFSGGYLFYNGDRIRADLQAKPDAIFTINNIDWFSDNADPVHGTGRLTLGGSGFLLTAGYGRVVSRSEKHFSFPFEAGVAFINTPNATLNLAGQICTVQGINCQPAATYPGFADALAAQLTTWNKNAAPFHIFPLVEGGVAYTFRIRR